MFLFSRKVIFSILAFLSLLSATQITHGPYIQNMAENSVRIIWHTDKNCFSHVEYGPTRSLGTIIRASQHGLFDAYTTIHNIRITGLEKGKKYYYRVISREIIKFEPYSVKFGQTAKSSIYSFNTFNKEKESFSFIAISDIHGDGNKLRTMLDNVNWKAVDFVAYIGDIAQAISDVSHIWSWLDPSVEKFARECPFVYIMGNHEKRGSFARSLPNYLSGEDNTGRFYYAFTHGKVRFIILDSGEDKEDSHSVYAGLVNFDAYRVEQAIWLKDEETKSDEFKNALFRIVFVHIPTASTQTEHGILHLRTLMQPIFNESGVELTIVGHTHSFARRNPKSGRNEYYELNNSTTTTTKVDVISDRLIVTVIERDGNQIDRFKINSNKKITIPESNSPNQ